MPIEPNETFLLDKFIWTEEDFDRMGWHDAVIHAIAFKRDEHEIMFDIDYIFAWVNPEPPPNGYTFWVAPSTLVFENASNLSIDFASSFKMQINGISRQDSPPPNDVSHTALKTQWRWNLDLFYGNISLTANGFHQYTRSKPTRGHQTLGIEERGGISFSRPAFV